MRKLAVILVFSLAFFAARPANAEPSTELTYTFVDNYVDHSTERGSGFGMWPQLSSSDDYKSETGIITVQRGAPDSAGIAPLDISERVKVGDPPKHEEVYGRVTIYLRPDGTVDQKRQFDQLTDEEVALAHFLVPNLVHALIAPKDSWTLGGLFDGVDDRTDYTVAAADPDSTSVLSFEQYVKGASGYSARGKVLYDGIRRLPLKAHTELRIISLSDTMFENIDYTFAPH